MGLILDAKSSTTEIFLGLSGELASCRLAPTLCQSSRALIYNYYCLEQGV